MKAVAIIPARGGSKGIPRKNVYPFNGRPLICWCIEAALEAESRQAALFDNEDSLSYPADGVIDPQGGAIEFWLQPLWDGDDGQSYVFFEIGDEWFNRFRLMKDGANNFRFMAWSSQVEYDAACSVGHWEAGEWHEVRAAWGDEALSLFLDGALCDHPGPGND